MVITAIITLFIFLLPSTILATEYKADTVIIPSVILNEPRDVIIYEPVDLQKTDSVSIIYLLDGEFSKYRYLKIADSHFDKPVVAIGIINTHRNRDLLPVKQSDKFLDFIEKELIPAVEKRYIIAERIIYGHSFAGGFTIYTMIHKPGLFDKFVASSPTPIMKMADAMIYLQLDKQLAKPIEFFFSCGSKDIKQVVKWTGILNNNLKGLRLNLIRWKYEVFNGQNHNSSDTISLIRGLQFK